MTKILNTIFPFVDFTYILQLADYNSGDYIQWIRTRFFKRNLQYVGHITWTTKAQVVASVAVLLYLIILYFVTGFAISLWGIIAVAGLTLLIPYLVALSNYMVTPLDHLIRQSTINQAAQKLQSLQSCLTIAIAGSYGKSSTRHFAYQLLENSYIIHTPRQNNNTLLSISQDILAHLSPETQVYIVELGEYHLGDLELFRELLDPDVVVITAVGPQHLHNFGSQEALDDEFLGLLNKTANKIRLVNGDDPGVKRLLDTHKEHVGYYSSALTLEPLGKVDASVLDVPQLRPNAAGAVAIAEALGLDKNIIKKNLEFLRPLERRMDVSVHNEITIIDDTYNINPTSAQAALEFLDQHKGRKIVVTGGIVDQGEGEIGANKKYADHISQVADIVVIANTTYRPILEATITERAKLAKIIISPHPDQTPGLLKNILQKGDVVLLQNELPDLYWH